MSTWRAEAEKREHRQSRTAAIAGFLLLIHGLTWGALRFEDIAPRIVEAASSEPDMTEDQWNLTQQISWLGPASVHRMTPLLKREAAAVRDLTTRILSHMHGLREESLDALIESKRSGNEAIAVAIAKIGTPRAAAFLVEELKKDKRKGTPTYWAMYLLGEKGVPVLVQLIQNEPLDEELAATVISLFGEWRDEAKSAVGPLTEFIAAHVAGERPNGSAVTDPNEGSQTTEPPTGPLTQSMTARRERKAVECAVLALGAIGEAAQASMPLLLKLAESDSSYKDAVDRSFRAMTTPETIAEVLRRLGECPGLSVSRADFEKCKRVYGESLVGSLIEFISLRQGNKDAIALAVCLLGEIGPNARQAVPLLLKLAEEDPGSYQFAVAGALLAMGAPQAAPGVLKMLEERPDRSFIRHIARLGKLGKPAGPGLVRCLERDDWELRLDAARAIGDIGYIEGAPHLIKLLSESDDWRLVFVAAKSLGRLRAAEAVGPLTELSKSHWYPPVREAAKEAILVIEGQAAYPENSSDPVGFLFEYDEYMRVEARSVPSSIGIGPQEAGQSPVADPNSLDQKQLAKLVYEEQQGRSDVDGEGRSVEKYDTFKRVPQVGIRVSDGYLVGFDQGEFGGELLFIDLAGKRTSLWENTQGVHKMPFGIVAVTGYGHLTNRGMLVKVFRGQDGTWQASRWKSLPGCPGGSVLLANGNLWIGCGSNGCVELTPSGELKMAGGGT
jgi:HEAT repeat protein